MQDEKQVFASYARNIWSFKWGKIVQNLKALHGHAPEDDDLYWGNFFTKVVFSMDLYAKNLSYTENDKIYNYKYDNL